MLTKLRKVTETVKVADNAEIPIIAKGESLVTIPESSVTISNISYAPDLAVNLLSVSEICSEGNTVEFSSQGCKIFNPKGQLLVTGRVENGLYKLNAKTTAVANAVAKGGSSIELWHRRLAHLNIKSLKELRQMSTGIEFENEDLAVCQPCLEGKEKRAPFSINEKRSSDVFELIHSDVCGFMEKTSLGGSRYFVTFIDDFSKKTFVYFLKAKDQVQEAFEDFKAYAENQTGKKIKVLRSDNGTEYNNKSMKRFLRNAGIEQEFTSAYNPEQNGRAERYNRRIQEKARCLLFDVGLNKEFWAEAVPTAVYLMNRSPNSKVKKTPEELFTGKMPDLSHLRVFGAHSKAKAEEVG